MNDKVIAIGLDAADPELLETWMRKGHLPNLERLRDQGTYGRLNTYDWYRAETPWTTFLTGVAPNQTGYWSPIKYRPEESKIEMVHAFDFAEFPPFYAYVPEKRVTIFDMPQAPLLENLQGEQVLAWGTHSGQTESVSVPPELWQELVDEHGPHPLLNDDGASCYSLSSLQDLFDRMKLGIQRRTDIFVDLIQSRPSDFFLTIFGEAHVAGHYFWHLGQPHPLGAALKKRGAPDLLLQSFQAIDDAIGKITAAAPEDATIVVFSAHGMGSNVMDLPSVVFLPELMFRWNFPGNRAIAPGEAGEPVPPMVSVDEMENDYFSQVVWRNTAEGSWLRTNAKRYLPKPIFRRLQRFLPQPPTERPDIENPEALRERGEAQPFQASTWFSSYWPQMKAFALPSFSEGYVRINVAGRDRHGIVQPEDYDRVCEEIIETLHELTDARTGKPMVERVVKTRNNLAEETPKSPDADLVVIWQEDTAADTVDSPTLGRIGPLPFLRTGSHRAAGFFLAHRRGATFSLKEEGHAIDLAPTLLALLGAVPPPQMQGSSLLNEPQVHRHSA